jgi:octaprenyl-diphosphate synthase
VDITEIAVPVSEHFDRFESEFEQKFHSVVPLVDKVIQYIARKRGKRLRPLLVFLSARLHGALTQKSMTAGIVVELFHTATLVHDDVVDDSNLRRGSRTVNDIWDNKVSILIGDLLFSKTLTSISELQDMQAMAIISAAAELITEGELLQIAYAENSHISEEDYFDLISKKTAALFSASCQLGVLSVKNDEDALLRMEGFGRNYGIAFQIMDDLLDYLGDENKLGKPTGNDLRDGKVTLPLIHALETAQESDRKHIIEMLDRGVETDTEIDFVVKFAVEQGGVEYAKGLVNEYTIKALNYLDAVPESDVKKSLVDLVHYSINRDK